MGKANLAVNQLLERKDIFADFINGTLFRGEQVLKEDDLTLLSGHAGIIEERYHERKAGGCSGQSEMEYNMSGHGKTNLFRTEQPDQVQARQEIMVQDASLNKTNQFCSDQNRVDHFRADADKTDWNGSEPGYSRTDGRTFTGKLGAFERYGDIRMEAGFSTYSVIFAHETQQHVHYAMPVRSMVYEALEYVRQVQELEKQHLAKGEKLRSDEFLSGLTKDDRLKPVVSVVLYLGDDWDGCKSLYEMLEIDETDEKTGQILPYLPRNQLKLISANDIKHPEFFRTSLQHIFSMLKYRQTKDELYEYIQRNRAALERMDHVEIMAAFILLGEQKRVEELFRSKAEREEIGMCKAIDDLIHDGEMRGEKRGERRGEKRLAALLNAIIQDGKQNLLSSIANDEVLRTELYLKYQL